MLLHEDLIPPETLEGVEDKETKPWRTEFDVISTLRKLGHIVEYGILAALVWRADRRSLVLILIVFAVALADETLQSRTARRSGSVVDVFFDMVGAAVVLGAVQAHRLIGKIRRGL